MRKIFVNKGLKYYIYNRIICSEVYCISSESSLN